MCWMKNRPTLITTFWRERPQEGKSGEVTEVSLDFGCEEVLSDWFQGTGLDRNLIVMTWKWVKGEVEVTESRGRYYRSRILMWKSYSRLVFLMAGYRTLNLKMGLSDKKDFLAHQMEKSREVGLMVRMAWAFQAGVMWGLGVMNVSERGINLEI